MRKFNINLATKKVAELRELCKEHGIKGYSKLKKDELIAELSKIEKQIRKAEYQKAYKAELTRARYMLKEDFATCYKFYRNLKGRKLRLEDIDDMLRDWQLLSYLVGGNEITNGSLDIVAQYLRGVFAPAGIKASDISSWSERTKREFISNMLDGFKKATTTEILTKENVEMLKFGFKDIQFGDDANAIAFDSSKAVKLKAEELAKLNIHEKKTMMRWVATSEDGCTRMLKPLGKNLISINLDTSEEERGMDKAILINMKFMLMKYGIVDKATGKRYRFCFQTASGKRKANYLFVEAETQEEVFQIWFDLSGTKNAEGFYKAFGTRPSISKMNTYLATRVSNSLNVENGHSQEEIDRFRKGTKVLYFKDAQCFINRPYKTIVGPGQMELIEKTRKLKPGDGQCIGSGKFFFDITKFLRKIDTVDYDDICRIWESCGRDIQRAKNNARFMKIWKRIIKLVQDRLGSFKGITVFFNYENIKITLTQELADMLNERNIEQFTAGQEICLGDYDLLVPDSVRKYTAGEFEDYPFEVCNYLKRKKEWVNLNQQFINALKIKPDALQPIVEYWFNYMKESLLDDAKATVFHSIVFDEDDEEQSILPKALRANQKLAKDAQVLKWRQAPYEKMLNDIHQGRLKVPGMYTYMVTDPAYVLNNVFGLDLPCLQSGENYFNGLECNVGAFRAPLIAQQNAQKVPVVDIEDYWYMRDMLVFNGFDGQWESMQGADFDGDTCGVVPDNNVFGKIIVDGIIDRYDVYEEGFDAVRTDFSFDNMDPYWKRLAVDANPDETGKMTNYAVASQEICNHLESAVEYCKQYGLERIILRHPKEYGYNEETGNLFGSNVKPTINRTAKTLTMRGFVVVSWNKQLKKFEFDDENGIYGEFTLEQIEEIAEQFRGKCEYTSPLVARAIDCAKTAIGAEGYLFWTGIREGKTAKELESVNEFVDSIKTIIRSDAFITKNKLKGKEISFRDKINTYVSLSPLGRLHAYVGAHRNEILDMFKDETSINFNSYLLTLLTQEEYAELYRPLKTKSGMKNIIQCLEERRTQYNTAIRNLVFLEDDDDDKEDNSIKKIKDDEKEFLINKVANYYGLSPEVIAVACYICAYSRDTKEGLTYGWLLDDTLLSVFSRGNERFVNVPVSSYDLMIRAGWLYEDGKKKYPINAEDSDYVPVVAGANRLFAHIKKKVHNIVDNSNRSVVVSGNETYTVKALGFRYHSAETAQNWLNAVVANNNEFSIRLNSEGRLCAFIGEDSISMVEYGKSFELLNKTVKMINTPQLDNSSIRDIQVAVVG